MVGSTLGVLLEPLMQGPAYNLTTPTAEPRYQADVINCAHLVANVRICEY